MTDQSKAPEHGVLGNDGVFRSFDEHYDTMKEWSKTLMAHGVRYTRSDLIEARVSAEVEAVLRKAAACTDSHASDDMETSMVAEDICEQILALIDRPSALDEMLDEKDAENARLRGALKFYDPNTHTLPNDGPWGAESDDFGRVARAALEVEPSAPTEPLRIVGYRGAIAVPITLILSNGQELEFDPDQFCDGGE